jgi:cytochrome c biogenesis protein
MKSIIDFFSSVKLAIFLIIIIIAASFIGTLIPQLRTAEEYATRYGALSALLIRLEFTNLYHSWWYIALLFLFTLNILICTLTRLSPKIRRTFKPNLKTDPKALLSAKIHDRFMKDWDLKESERGVRKELRSAHYRIKRQEEGSLIHLLASKRKLGLFGSDVVHLGLLIILLGGIISGLGSIRGNIGISEGQIVPVLDSDFKLRLDKFETEYWPNGSIKDWKSTLTVIENDIPDRTKTVEVNHPLSYKGYVFYQSTYGWDWKNPSLEIRVTKKSDPAASKTVDVRIAETAIWKEEGLEFKILQFVPDFIIDGNQIRTRSLEPNNPAAFVESYKDGEKISSGWIFLKFPDFSQMHSSVDTGYTFEFKDVKAAQYSGIQVSKDPGVNFIWAGCAFVMLGLFMAFYWPPRDIRILLKKSEGKTEIMASGRATKSKLTMESEFQKLMASLRRSK